MPKKTFEIARRQGAGLIVSVKADKPGLLREMQESFGYFNLKPKRFNFVESGVPVFKEYAVLPVNERTLGGQPEWRNHLKCIVRVLRVRAGHAGPSFEHEYYACNKMLSPERAERLVRRHWRVENKLHFRLDVGLGEDAQRKSNFSGFRVWLNAIAANWLAKRRAKNGPKAQGWGVQLIRNAASLPQLLAMKGLIR